jgi:cytochrome c6
MKKVAGIMVLLGLFSLVAFADGGADLYKAKCQSCHGANGTPNPAMAKSMGMKDLGSADVQGKSDADLKTAIDKGKGKMPAFAGKITDEQQAELVKYVRSLKK